MTKTATTRALVVVAGLALVVAMLQQVGKPDAAELRDRARSEVESLEGELQKELDAALNARVRCRLEQSAFHCTEARSKRIVIAARLGWNREKLGPAAYDRLTEANR